MRDLTTSLNIVRAIPPAAAVSDNTPFVSSIIDLAGFEGCTFAIIAGSLSDADATFAVTLEHGNDAALADTAAAPAATMTGTLASASFTFSDDNKVRKLGYVGSKRYVRLTVTPSNNAGAAFVAAVAILGFSRFTAPAQSL